MTPGTPELRALWSLDPTIRFLNHGSFGATPRAIVDAQRSLRNEMEANPVDFLTRSRPARLSAAIETLARYVGADRSRLLAVGNATTAINIVLDSFTWSEGDEILLADQSYNAVKQAARYHRDRFGIRLVEARIPFPLAEASDIAEAYEAAITPRTRLLVADHVVSATALVMPVADIVAVARRNGVPVLVDGAHGPGMLPLELDELRPDFYAGNLHKWVCAPKGAAFLYGAPAYRERILTAAAIYGAEAAAELDGVGLDDPTAWLSVPAALNFWEQLGVDEARSAAHALVRDGRQLIAATLRVELPHTDDPTLYGSMAAIPFPIVARADATQLQALTSRMYAQHGIEVPFTGYDGRVFVRISGQVYNSPTDYEKLAAALRDWT